MKYHWCNPPLRVHDIRQIEAVGAINTPTSAKPIAIS